MRGSFWSLDYLGVRLRSKLNEIQVSLHMARLAVEIITLVCDLYPIKILI